MLNTITEGAPNGTPPLLVAHGLFGAARNWGVLQKRMAASRQVIAVDMRNHGESPHLPSHSYPDMAADLAEVIAAHGGRADVLGHSMGGKAAMALALTQPDLVNRLIVADIAPVAYTHSQADKIMALRQVDLPSVTRRSEADAQLKPHLADDMLRAFLLQSLRLGEGGASWRLNLDVLERDMGHIIGWPEVSGQYEGETLFLRGELSDYVQPAHAAHITALFPNARTESIAGANHWLHAEKPREFQAAVEGFLGEVI
ncbi:MAG: alpha/beta fold hydrolase [Paracoccaceae bacterium]